MYPNGEWNNANCKEPRGYVCAGPIPAEGMKYFVKKVFDLSTFIIYLYIYLYIYIYSMKFQRTFAPKILAKTMEYAIIILMAQDMNVFAMDPIEGRIVKSPFMKIMKVC